MIEKTHSYLCPFLHRMEGISDSPPPPNLSVPLNDIPLPFPTRHPKTLSTSVASTPTPLGHLMCPFSYLNQPPPSQAWHIPSSHPPQKPPPIPPFSFHQISWTPLQSPLPHAPSPLFPLYVLFKTPASNLRGQDKKFSDRAHTCTHGMQTHTLS